MATPHLASRSMRVSDSFPALYADRPGRERPRQNRA